MKKIDEVHRVLKQLYKTAYRLEESSGVLAGEERAAASNRAVELNDGLKQLRVELQSDSCKVSDSELLEIIDQPLRLIAAEIARRSLALRRRVRVRAEIEANTQELKGLHLKLLPRYRVWKTSNGIMLSSLSGSSLDELLEAAKKMLIRRDFGSVVVPASVARKVTDAIAAHEKGGPGERKLAKALRRQPERRDFSQSPCNVGDYLED